MQLKICALVVGSAALRRRHDDARDAKFLRVELSALIPREGLGGRVVRGELDGELQVGRTETPSFVKVVQSLLESPLQLKRIVLL